MTRLCDSNLPFGLPEMDPRVGHPMNRDRWGTPVDPMRRWRETAMQPDMGHVMKAGWRRILRLSGLSGG